MHFGGIAFSKKNVTGSIMSARFYPGTAAAESKASAAPSISSAISRPATAIGKAYRCEHREPSSHIRRDVK